MGVPLLGMLTPGFGGGAAGGELRGAVFRQHVRAVQEPRMVIAGGSWNAWRIMMWPSVLRELCFDAEASRRPGLRFHLEAPPGSCSHSQVSSVKPTAHRPPSIRGDWQCRW